MSQSADDCLAALRNSLAMLRISLSADLCSPFLSNCSICCHVFMFVCFAHLIRFSCFQDFFPDFFQLDPKPKVWVLFLFLKRPWGSDFFLSPVFSSGRTCADQREAGTCSPRLEKAGPPIWTILFRCNPFLGTPFLQSTLGVQYFNASHVFSCLDAMQCNVASPVAKLVHLASPVGTFACHLVPRVRHLVSPWAV